MTQNIILDTISKLQMQIWLYKKNKKQKQKEPYTSMPIKKIASDCFNVACFVFDSEPC